jgi:CRISPR-associated protein Cas2
VRRCYLVVYDIRCPRRWRQVYKIMGGHERWNYSAYFCTLKEIDRVRIQSQLEEAMNLKEDQCVIVDLGPNEEAARESATVLGPSLPKGDGGVLVI